LGEVEEAPLVWDRVLAVHGAHLSHAIIDVDSGGWLAADQLPDEAKSAASRLRPLAAGAQRGASWLQRARTNGLVRLDLTQPEQLDLLRCYGPFATDTRVWVQGDPTPVIETGDSFGDLPRFTYRLDPVELEHAQALLAEPAWPAPLSFPAACARPGPSTPSHHRQEASVSTAAGLNGLSLWCWFTDGSRCGGSRAATRPSLPPPSGRLRHWSCRGHGLRRPSPR
jgi:hypothetical protein